MLQFHSDSSVSEGLIYSQIQLNTIEALDNSYLTVYLRTAPKTDKPPCLWSFPSIHSCMFPFRGAFQIV